MEKIAIVTDTAADLDKETIREYGIRVLPFRIIYPDREYRDGVDITSEKIYADIPTIHVKSSLPSMEEMDELFTGLVDEGYTHTIVVTLSSGLSGIYNGVRLAAERHPDLIIHVEDSRSISMGEGVLAIEAARLARQQVPFEEIVERVGSMKERVKLFFVVETLEYLIRGGRIGRVAGSLAEMMNVKPVIGSSLTDGKYETVARVRGRRKSIERLLSLVQETAQGHRCKAYILHGNAREEMQAFADQVQKVAGITEVVTGDNITPVAGVHSGPGLIGVVLVREED